jgi:PKD domain
MLGVPARNFSTGTGFQTTMLSMRLCAGLVLSVAACLATPSPASADTYCADPFPATAAHGRCPASPVPLQTALDLASAHPGADTVGLNSGSYYDIPNLVYSDRGQPDNAVTITAMPRCGRYGCEPVQVNGKQPGTLMSFIGGGGADVTVSGFSLWSENGTALALPPGARATGMSVGGGPGGAAVRIEGTAARPAVISSGSVSAARLGNPRGVGVEVAGHGILESVWVSGDIGARVRPGGSLDVFAGVLQSTIGVTGSNARVVGTVVNQTYQGDRAPGERAVAFEAACVASDSADAVLTVTNVTVIGGGRADTTGVRATGRGGDGNGCDAVARVNSTILSRVAIPLDAHGEDGSGAAPVAGRARVAAAYSNFDAEAIASSGPGEVETTEPGRNLDVSSGFEYARLEESTGPEALLPDVQLRRDSLMIDRGDPAPPEPWQAKWIPVVNGRRDIGAFEYGLRMPRVWLSTTAYYPVPPRRVVRFEASPDFVDAEGPIDLRWSLSDGTSAAGRDVVRVYPRPGRYTERVVATRADGRSVDNSVTVTVVRQRVGDLVLSRDRFRPSGRYQVVRGMRGTKIYLDLAALDDVTFRVERAVRAKRTGKRRWRRLPGSLEGEIPPFGFSGMLFSGWLDGKPLRPGRYRLVAIAHGAPRRHVRAGFTVIR